MFPTNKAYVPFIKEKPANRGLFKTEKGGRFNENVGWVVHEYVEIYNRTQSSVADFPSGSLPSPISLTNNILLDEKISDLPSPKI